MRAYGFRWLLGVGLFVCGLQAGCGVTKLSKVDYQSSCTTANDCTAVFFGDVCGCACPNDAINKSDLAHYQADYQTAHGHCTGAVCQADCIAPTVVCSAGTCALGK